jgi:hypothetical protein
LKAADFGPLSLPFARRNRAVQVYGEIIAAVRACGSIIDVSWWEAIGTWVELIGTLITGVGLFIAWRRASRIDNRLRASILNLVQQITRRFAETQNVNIQPGPAGAEARMPSPWVYCTRDYKRFGPYQDQIDELVKEAEVLREYTEWVRGQLTEFMTTSTATSSTFLTREEFRAGLQRELSHLETSHDRISVRDLTVALAGLAITAVGIALPLPILAYVFC